MSFYLILFLCFSGGLWYYRKLEQQRIKKRQLCELFKSSLDEIVEPQVVQHLINLNSLEDFVTTYKTACLQFVPFHCAAGKTAV